MTIKFIKHLEHNHFPFRYESCANTFKEKAQ